MSHPPSHYRPRLQATLDRREPKCSLRVETIRPSPYHFSGHITPADGGAYRDIFLGYDPGWRWQRERVLRDYSREQSLPDPVEATLHFVLHHEIGHRHGCPGTLAMGNQLHAVVGEVLARHAKPALTHHCVNLLADILVNVATVRDGHAPVSGIAVEWHDQGDARMNWPQRLRAVFGRPPASLSPYFSIFVEVQLRFFGTPAERRLLERYLSLPPAACLAADELEALYRDESLTAEPSAWPALFTRGAEILAPFLPDKPPPERTSEPHPFFNPLDPEEARRRGSPTWYDAEREVVRPAPGDGQREGNLHAVDWSYRKESRALPLRPVKLPKPPRANALFNLTPTGAALSSVEHWPELHHIAFAIDTSGSMMTGEGEPAGAPVNWKRGSPYHHALVSLYRILQWAEAQPAIHSLNVLTFGTVTRATGRFVPGDFLAEAGSIVLDPSVGFWTRLDVSELTRQLRAQPGTLLFILTDGQINNAGEVLQALTGLRHECMPILFLFGPSNAMGESMRQAGFAVHDGLQAEGLAELIVGEISARVRE